MTRQLPFRIEPMEPQDIPAVMRIERDVFPTPWSEIGYRRELTRNKMARYFVLRVQQDEPPRKQQFSWLPARVRARLSSEWQVSKVIGYAGYWTLPPKVHITTLALDRGWRRRGLGEWLLIHLLADAIARGAERATLEVRSSNTPARALYTKYGFQPVKRRKHYYADGEDADLMECTGLQDESFQQTLAARRASIAALLERGRQPQRNENPK